MVKHNRMTRKLLQNCGPKRVDKWFDIKIHQLMFQDKLRTLSYKKAIIKNVKKNDVVLDMGCGTGILAFFAAKKGCKKTYAIDNSDIINAASKAAKLNKLETNIEFIKEDILKFKPQEKFDVLIHDQIGNFLWDEDIISKVAYIRDNFLNQNAIIIPSKIDLYLVPINYKTNLEKCISFWARKKYGFDFSNLETEAFIQGYRAAISPSVVYLKDTKSFLGREKLAYRVDLMKETGVPLEIITTFTLKKNSRLTGMCAYFKVHLEKGNIFSTRPRIINTHWGQIFFPCIEEKTIKRDSVLTFKLFPNKVPKKWEFKFKIEEK